MKRRIVSLALAFFFMAALLPQPVKAYNMAKVGQTNTLLAGDTYSGIIDPNETLWLWGDNYDAQMGSHDIGNATYSVYGSEYNCQTTPIRVLENVISVSGASDHVAVLRSDGSLWTWGQNKAGQLGNGTASFADAGPAQIMDGVVAVSAGGGDVFGITAAIKNDGSLWMWGSNAYYALGNGGIGNGTAWNEDRATVQTEPIKVMDNVAAVSCGSNIVAAIKTDGSLWMWGKNDCGQLGSATGDVTNRFGRTCQSTPVKVMDNVRAVSCGADHAAAIKTDGSLWMWGKNADGQLGNGTTTSSSAPIKVLDNVSAVSCGSAHTAAIKTDGTLWTWGYNNFGQLGNGNTRSSSVPVKVLNHVAAVSCGSNHTVVVASDGMFGTCGDNAVGQLGNGTQQASNIFIQVRNLTAKLPGDMLPVNAPAPVIPAYTFPTTDAMAQEAADAALADTDAAEPAAAYQLADGLYYVLLNQDSGLVGRVVKGVKEQGETVWKVIQSHDEPAAQEELDRLLAQELSTSNLPLDFGRLASLPSVQDVVSYLQDCLDNLNGLTVNDPAKAELATFIESALASLASSSLSSPDNRLTISAKTVSDLAGQAKSAKAKLDEALSGSGVVLNKELDNLLRVLWQDVDSGAPCQVTLDRDLANALGGSSLRVLLGDDRHYIQLSPDAVSGLLERYGTVSVQMSQSGETTYAVNFLDDTGEILEQIDFPVTIGLPASGPLNTVMASYAGGSDNWGGQYDESTGSMAFETRYSGQYEVLENDISINDIEALDQETRTAVAFLVSKGYMSAPDGVFQPDIPLSRYDFTQALVGMFFALDRSLTTSFPDVPQDSAYYPYVASAEADDIVEGYDGIFFGEQDITVEQMLAIAARTLRERKGYLPPENADSYLSSLAGADQVAGWARELVAQTVRDGIMDRTDALDPKGGVTRAQAALILYRLFLRLYEVSPVALELPPAVEVPEAPEISEAPAETKPAEEKSFPAGVVIALVAAGAGAAGAGIYFKKKKSQE